MRLSRDWAREMVSAGLGALQCGLEAALLHSPAPVDMLGSRGCSLAWHLSAQANSQEQAYRFEQQRRQQNALHGLEVLCQVAKDGSGLAWLPASWCKLKWPDKLFLPCMRCRCGVKVPALG